MIGGEITVLIFILLIVLVVFFIPIYGTIVSIKHPNKAIFYIPATAALAAFLATPASDQFMILPWWLAVLHKPRSAGEIFGYICICAEIFAALQFFGFVVVLFLREERASKYLDGSNLV